MENYLGITINNDLDKEFNDHALSLLRKYYLREDETPQQAFARDRVAYSKEFSNSLNAFTITPVLESLCYLLLS